MNFKLYVVGGRTAVGGAALASAFEGEPLHAVPGDDVVGLNWGVEAGTYPLASYKLYRSTSSPESWGGLGAPAYSFGPGTTSYTDAAVTNGNAYFYIGVADDVRGHQGLMWDVATLPISAPANLTAVAGSSAIALSWDPIANPDGENLIGYSVFRTTYAGVGLIDMPSASLYMAGMVSRNQTWFTDVGLTNGTKYFYVVRAISSQTFWGNPSNEAWATPAYIQPPGVPQDLVATPGLDQVVKLTWTASCAGGAAITGYRVWRTTMPATSPKVTGIQIASVILPQSATVFMMLVDQTASAAFGRTYYYALDALDENKPPTLSGESAVASAMPGAGYWRMARGDVEGTGRSQLADGLRTSLAVGWSIPTSGTVWGTPAVNAADGSLYVTDDGALGGFLYHIDATGGVLWSPALPVGGVGTVSSPSISYADEFGTVDRIYVGGRSGAAGYLYSFDNAGVLVWSRLLGGPVNASPLPLPGGGVIVGADNGVVRAYQRDGSIAWTANLPGAIVGAVGFVNDAIVVGCGDWNLYGLRPDDGLVLGSIALTGTPSGFSADPVRKHLYVATRGGRLHDVDVNVGPTIAWTGNAGGAFVGAPAFDQTTGNVFAACTDGLVYGFNVADPAGTFASEDTGAPILSSIAVAAKGRLYWTDEAGRATLRFDGAV